VRTILEREVGAPKPGENRVAGRDEKARDERRLRVHAIAGKYRDVGGSVEEFLVEKRAATIAEEARDERRWRGRQGNAE
jgi:hypothetical protein